MYLKYVLTVCICISITATKKVVIVIIKIEILYFHHNQCSYQKAIIMIVVVFMSRDNDNRFCTYMRLRFLLSNTLQIETHLRNDWLQHTYDIVLCAFIKVSCSTYLASSACACAPI